MILAIDPGKDKTGIAVYDQKNRQVVYRAIIPSTNFVKSLEILRIDYLFQSIVIGDGTLSKDFQIRLKEAFPEMQLVVVDEAYSTLEARQLYFELYPPKGLKRLLPLSMQSPPVPVDDLVAVVLLKRHLGDMPKIGR